MSRVQVCADSRSYSSTIGLVLAAVVVNGRNRLLVMRSTGEIWPVTEANVTFVMPSSLIPEEVATGCWSPELLQLWASGEDIGISSSSEQASVLGEAEALRMANMRRQASLTLRKVQRETERMEARLLSAGEGRGGVDSVYETYAHDTERRSVSAQEVAEHLLNGPGAEKRVAVGRNTLPAFAAHSLLMRRSDLFVADERDMHISGRFMIRSRAERELRDRAQELTFWDTPELKAFVEKAKAVKAALDEGENPPEWSEQDRELLHILTLPMVELRSTQILLANPIATSIVKSLGREFRTSETIDQSNYTAILEKLGLLSRSDSLRKSIVHEDSSRAAAVDGVQLPVNPGVRDQPTAADSALDHLRQDMGHTAFVIDDEGAKELDDGIALQRDGENYWVHVHVADPTRFLDRGDALATRAAYTGSSLYLPEGTVPLLPPDFGKGSLSLGSSAGQPTMVMSAKLSPEGDVLDTNVRLGWLKSATVTTYAAVNSVLGVSTPEPTYPFGRSSALASCSAASRSVAELDDSNIADLKALQTLASKVRAKRFARGGVEWEQPRPSFYVRGASAAPNLFEPSAIPTRSSKQGAFDFEYSVGSLGIALPSAQMTVAEFMVLANWIAAEFLSSRGVAAMFRGIIPPRETTRSTMSVEDLLAKRVPGTGCVDQTVMEMATLAWGNPTVTADAREQWLVGLPAYIRATSPLRRWDDLVAHWQLKAALARDAGLSSPGLKPISAEDMESEIFRSKHALRRAKRANEFGIDYYTALAVQRELEHPNEMPDPTGRVDLTKPLKGTIRVGGTETHAIASVPELGIKISIFTDNLLPVGEKVDLKITEAQTFPNPVITAELV